MKFHNTSATEKVPEASRTEEENKSFIMGKVQKGSDSLITPLATRKQWHDAFKILGKILLPA